jgi:hypothetical protein
VSAVQYVLEEGWRPPAEVAQFADAVEALRWIAEFAADERTRFQARTALARLDALNPSAG